MKNNKQKVMGTLKGMFKKKIDVQGAVDKANPLQGTQSRIATGGRPAMTKITEDNPLWDSKTMGNKKPLQVQALKKQIPQYGDKQYKPSNGVGVGP